MASLLNLPGLLVSHLLASLNQAFRHLTQPASHSLVLGTVADLTRSRAQLIAENALLRQQLIVRHRQVKKPRCTSIDRLWFVLLASRLPNWRELLLILQPDTLLRWHRQGFCLFWKCKSRSRGGRPQVRPELIALIQRMASENRSWGAERIRGELLKLSFHVAKGTVQKYLVPIRPHRSPSQNWSTFLKNHAEEVWACDSLPVIDLLFRPLYLFFIVELASRRVVHFGVTRSPTDAWVAQQLREATPYGEAPRFLIRDRDRRSGEAFTRVAKGSSIQILKTPFRAPRANAVCERFFRQRAARMSGSHFGVRGAARLLCDPRIRGVL
jgi:putative transposase